MSFCIACDSGDCGPLIEVLIDEHVHGSDLEGYCTHEAQDEGDCSWCMKSWDECDATIMCDYYG